jgi:Amt family ammonium transporter
MAWIIGKIIDKTMGFRIAQEDEVTGIDLAEHAETAYDLGSVHSGQAAVPHAGQKAQEAVARDVESVTGAR